MNIGFLTDSNGSIRRDVERESAAYGVTLHVADQQGFDKLANVPMFAWMASGDGLDFLLSRSPELQVPLLFVPSDEPELLRMLGKLRPIDEVCGVGESTTVRLMRVCRMGMRHAGLKRDSLTGLGNRKAFEDASLLWRRTVTDDSIAAVFFLDIDLFKSINDLHGHSVGDEVLRQVAWRLEGLPGVECPTRYGGEEFVWLSSAADFAGLESLAMLAVAAVGHQEISVATGASLRVTASVGWALVSPDGSIDTAIQQADMALYHAKGAGRNRAVSHHGMSAGQPDGESDVELLHFENVAKVVTERTARLVSLIGKGIVERARAIANRDPLTGAWNRGYLDRRLAREITMSRLDGRPLAIALIDLDHFGRFNKEHGTPTGDAVLRAFVRVAEASLRATDWLARYGGEEFVIVVPGTDAEAHIVAERVRLNLESTQIDRVALSGSVRVTGSVGVASFSEDMKDADALFQRASDALNAAKQAGRNRVVLAADQPV